MFQGKFEFHKGLEVIRCCLGKLGKSVEAYPHMVVSLDQPFVINFKLHSCLYIPFMSVSVGRQNLVYTIETIESVIKYTLTFIPISCI